MTKVASAWIYSGKVDRRKLPSIQKFFIDLTNLQAKHGAANICVKIDANPVRLSDTGDLEDYSCITFDAFLIK